VHRTTGPWTETVHAFLRHLEDAGFDSAPRLLGVDEQGREVLTFIEGDVLVDPAWEPGRPTPWPEWARSEDCLVDTARLLRRLHEVSASFVAPVAARWRQHPCPGLGDGELVCHGDVGPHNTVYRDGQVVALIDWDGIRPNEPLVEFGNAAWLYVPLADDAYFAASGFERRPDLARRLAVFAREYGIDDCAQLAWSLHQARQRSVEAARYWPITPAGGAGILRHVASQLDWLDTTIDHLVAQL
jgi:Ser/Thr protein kinase RdoA (MazF antagonist)